MQRLPLGDGATSRIVSSLDSGESMEDVLAPCCGSDPREKHGSHAGGWGRQPDGRLCILTLTLPTTLRVCALRSHLNLGTCCASF